MKTPIIVSSVFALASLILGCGVQNYTSRSAKKDTETAQADADNARTRNKEIANELYRTRVDIYVQITSGIQTLLDLTPDASGLDSSKPDDCSVIGAVHASAWQYQEQVKALGPHLGLSAEQYASVSAAENKIRVAPVSSNQKCSTSGYDDLRVTLKLLHDELKKASVALKE